MDTNFNNKVCLIIGGSRGIGFALAEHLYSLGSKIIIASKKKNHAKKAALLLNPNLEKVDYFKIDIANSNGVASVINRILEKYKKIDILICSAGIFKPFGEFITIPFASHEKNIKTNLIGIMKCCHCVIPQMIKEKKGKIILFSGAGIGGDIPLENASSYFVSKGSLALFAEVLAAELKKYNIQVNAISPGRILTDLTKPTLTLSDKTLGKVLKKAAKNLKKTGGQSMKPVLELVTFLCMDKSNKLSGKLLSAKWDSIDILSKSSSSWKYTLRRIEGNMYVRKKGV